MCEAGCRTNAAPLEGFPWRWPSFNGLGGGRVSAEPRILELPDIYGGGPNLGKAIHIKLPDEGGETRMAEVLGENGSLEQFDVMDGE